MTKVEGFIPPPFYCFRDRDSYMVFRNGVYFISQDFFKKFTDADEFLTKRNRPYLCIFSFIILGYP